MNKPSYLIVPLLLLLVLGAVFFYGNKQNSGSHTSIDGISADSEEELGSEGGTLSKPLAPKNLKRAYVLQDRVMTPPGNALEAIKNLRAKAETGDAKASLAIYMKLGECSTAQNGISDEEVQAYKRTGMNSEAILADSEKRKSDCAGVGELLNERGVWLEQAANSGLAEAQLLYAIDSQAILGNETEMLRNPQKVQQYKNRASQYLNALASDGNIDAMVSLAAAYDGGVLLNENAVRSYAYYKAAELARPNTVPANLIDALRAKLSAGEAANADLMAKQIYSECCKN